MDAPMDDAAMEQYADWLDNLEKTDPDGYKQFIDTMQSQLQAAGLGPDTGGGAPQGDADAALFDMLKSSAGARAGADANSPDFKPRFPGDKVMGEDGLKVTPEGMYIDVTPGFVMKTNDVKSKKKVFVNVVYADEIQAFSEKKKLDDEGKEQEGIHVPLSLGAPHEVKDKKGVSSLAFDVAVNTKVVEDCQTDKTGAFRNFVCELAIEYIDQKYNIKLDDRYKLPRLTYRGDLPPPKHYIRKTQAPIIQEVAGSSSAASKKTHSAKPGAQKSSKRPSAPKTATAHYEVFERHNSERTACSRLPSMMKGSTPLSPEVLQQAGQQLIVSVRFENEVKTASDIDLELQAELLSVKATTHHDLEIFLPYPVEVKSARVCLDRSRNSMELTLTIDKSWDTLGPDCGSAPWILARALDEENEAENAEDNTASATDSAPPKPKSLVEMFHLANAADSNETSLGNGPSPKTTPRWDPVMEDEELPEDRFHRKDMMSMHILEQRRMEREQKAKEAEDKRKKRRAEVEDMQKKAKEAGKTWREMYPDEPETTYIDMEDIVRQEKERIDRHLQQKEENDPTASECIATEDARRAAARWSDNNMHNSLDLQSALAFDLL
ncbi:60s ribosomal protein l21-1 [Phytophthora cinnamomi]|uniref:60s ribosomal protein l21-1 n=1 Tax=Phytophthora cinnamomi TaxID=4785 RepID=UPI00355A1A9D|nr:60s ribosomal protein l21-1 [Phytophthora cinnamomi]